jgi:hypothetical protein
MSVGHFYDAGGYVNYGDISDLFSREDAIRGSTSV